LTNQLHPFHLAPPVTGLAAAETFYAGLPGCGNALEFKGFSDPTQLFST
jgi:extradiol dioxygenase family protein